ncbi:MAG: dTMP kinase [Candidatus Omnitrophica bacterium]|nr:dTMP kinase [Candidatus Omnitrophota bacterium]
MKNGMFIAFEGPEGSGKSTVSRRLLDDLRRDGYDAMRTIEPGDTELGALIREILLKKDKVHLTTRAELLLFEADRAEHVEEVIKPSLHKKRIVICDRFNTATYAYQGYGLGLDMAAIRDIDDFAVQGVVPDLVIVLDVDPKTGLERAGRKRAKDRMEKRSVDFHRRVRKGYLKMAEKDPRRFRVIDSGQDIERVYEQTKAAVYEHIGYNKRPGKGC